MAEVDAEIVIQSLKEQIGNMAQEIAVLNAMIFAMRNPSKTTTAVTPKVDGPQGIQTNT